MEIIVQVSPDVARQLYQGADSEFRIKIEALLRAFGGSLVPLHPDTEDPSLNRYFVVEVSVPGRAEELVQRLGMLPGIEGAYLKPSGSPP